MTAGGRPTDGEPELDRGYFYNCPGCNNIALEGNAPICPSCRIMLVWSGRTQPPLDQPRRHPGDTDAEVGAATLYAMAGEVVVENEHGVPATSDTGEVLTAARPLPPGQPAGLAGLADELNQLPPPHGEQSPASVASGVQEDETVALALDKPDSLPGESKPQVVAPKKDVLLGLPNPEKGKGKPVPKPVEPEVLEGLPEPPEGKEKQVPELLKAVDLSEARSALPDDPNPQAPISHLFAREIAEVAHAANLTYRKIVGDFPGPEWPEMDEAERESMIAGVRAVLCGTVVAASISHKAWYDRKVHEGWVYGPEKNIVTKRHPNMRAHGVWGDLPDHERRKDLLFLGVVVALIRDV